MKRMMFVLAVLAIVGVASTTVYAGGGVRGVQNVYNGGVIVGGYPGTVITNVYVDPYADDMYRIMSEHSPNRYYTHPRSLMNGPPVPPVSAYNNLYYYGY
jgi:hypothetical protein